MSAKKNVCERTSESSADVRVGDEVAEPAQETSTAQEKCEAQVTELRRCWTEAGDVVRNTGDKGGKHDPRIWEGGVHQLWLRLVVEQLVIRREGLDVRDLAAVSRMLRDQGKQSLSEGRHGGKSGGNGTDDPREGEKVLGRLVRQVYGANLQMD